MFSTYVLHLRCRYFTIYPAAEVDVYGLKPVPKYMGNGHKPPPPREKPPFRLHRTNKRSNKLFIYLYT